jgi:uncharacterized protein (DUF4415 family)
MSENRKHITRVSSDEARHLKDETDYARLDAMTDADIALAVAQDPDAPQLDFDWTQARLTLPPGKDVITLRLDRDMLDWFRAQGRGYQTRINQVLRAWYAANKLTAKAKALLGPGHNDDARVEALRKKAAAKRAVAKKAAAKRAGPQAKKRA